MQRYKFLLAATLFGIAGLTLVPRSLPAADVAVSIGVFHQQLAPYGRWVVAGSYGNVWVPRVAAGWVPYTDGEWVYTDYGWTWVSYDPWGDAPCHYGGWAWAGSYGWVWAPGTVWAPAWVTWAYGDDYVGWAPIPPTFALSVNGYAGAALVLPATRYVFVPTRQFVGVRVSTVRLPAERNVAIFAQAQKTTAFSVSGGIVRTAGPPPARIEKLTAQKIAPVPIDRVKTRPTTLAQAGPHSGSRVAVAAPATERARIAEKSESPVAAKKSEPAVAAKKPEKTGSEPSHSASAKAAPSNPAPHAEKPKNADHGQKNPQQGEANASTKPKPMPKAAAEKPSHAQAAKAPSPKPAPHKQPAAPPAEQSGNEETRVASHETKQAPPAAHSQKPPPKPKAPEHPQPPKEEKPGDKPGS